MKRTFLVGLALVALAGPSSGQLIPELPTLGSYWVDVGYPRLFYTPENGITGGLFYAQYQQLGFEDWDAAPQYRASISLDAIIATSGTGRLGLEAKLPHLVRGWRFDMRLWWQREARQNYFGLGNRTVFDKDSVNEVQPHYYKQDRKRLFARGTVQREIVKALRVLVGLHIERWRVDTLSGPSLYRDQIEAGLFPSATQATDEVNLRLGIVYDTRDDEVAPSRGLHIEAIYSLADSSMLGDVEYDRMTVSAAAYLQLSEKLTAAVRAVGQAMGGDPQPGTYYMVEASEAAYSGLGGPRSHRGLRMDRFLGRDKLFGNLDARYRVVGERHVVSATLVGFLDAGRVFQPGEDDFKLTLDGMHVGGGGGLILAFGRGGVLGWTLGYGPDALILQTHVGWVF